jgi:hypothetical protein
VPSSSEGEYKKFISPNKAILPQSKTTPAIVVGIVVDVVVDVVP